ncbi:MFS transporter [Leifsonia shinshuensis]|uniref:MFS transporter n=1 Tax=Leifsonia shinshuensis TaxID=150026 RepID=UPI002862C4BF|nr:MFS transporter [Leifsonia shinshuensis]MDR6972898.1 MFS family permease [Leifsonia shinshuensis]
MTISATTPGGEVGSAAVDRTPLPRLLSALFVSNVSAFVGLLTPLQLLMTLHLTRIAGPEAAAAFGVVTGFGALFALIGNPLGGRISDRTAARFGRRRTWILTGAVGGSLTVVGMSFTTAVWQMAIIWCATQLLFNFQLAATSALIADQVPQTRRGTASGVIGLSAAVGPLLGIAAVSAISDPAAQWIVTAVASAGLGTVAVLLLRDRQHRLPAGQRRLGLIEIVKSLWLNPWHHPAFGWAWLARFLITCAIAASSYNAFFLIDRFKVTPAAVAGSVLLLSLINVALLALTSVVAGLLSDRLGRQKPFAIAAGILAAGAMTLMAVASDMSLVFVAIACLGIATGLLSSVDLALCVRVLPSKENAGKDLGVVNMANTLPQSIVPFVAPALLALGSFGALYIALGIAAILGAVAVIRIPEVGRESDPRFAAITRPSAVRA